MQTKQGIRSNYEIRIKNTKENTRPIKMIKIDAPSASHRETGQRGLLFVETKIGCTLRNEQQTLK